MFSIPTSTVTDLMASVGDVFTSVWTLVVLAIAIPLAFVIIHYIKGLFGRSRRA